MIRTGGPGSEQILVRQRHHLLDQFLVQRLGVQRPDPGSKPYSASRWPGLQRLSRSQLQVKIASQRSEHSRLSVRGLGPVRACSLGFGRVRSGSLGFGRGGSRNGPETGSGQFRARRSSFSAQFCETHPTRMLPSHSEQYTPRSLFSCLLLLCCGFHC